MAPTSSASYSSASHETALDRTETVPRHQLLRLPAELVAAVIEQGDKKVIKVLRLVCRELHGTVDPLFIKTFFAHRCHLWTQFSLDVLMRITDSPRLRAGITSIALGRPSLRITSDDYNKYELRVHHACETMARKQGWYQKALVQILNNLRDVRPSLEIYGTQDSRRDAYGYSEYCRLLRSEQCRDQAPACLGSKPAVSDWQFSSIFLDSLIESDFKVARLKMPIDRMSILPPFVPKGIRFGLSVSTMTLLDLDINGFTSDILSDLRTHSGSLRALSTLILRNFPQAPEGTITNVRLVFWTLELRSIKLVDGVTSSRELDALLSDHCRTLRSLEVTNFKIDSSDISLWHWRSVLRDLWKEYSLDELRLSNLMPWPRKVEGACSDFRGADQVQAGLAQLTDTLPASRPAWSDDI
ncbi:hypothetical protein M409DRAFT_56991 [Zasmidium cellare ATCC 36951]|uniref:F-box domain-containing protein n=1 Tax=Zasmidium cellare ATCC 36951 TaxID=1080233 RepID=A0A6A6CCD7_ZASCE|nr:uncharacterized protein M409DRAFT_56991 [Zasmidium cellare ATCC 36951]KAF2163880.1 hypothetical protein M409DRAFT_56991 [Zasmidium cellare ATCC 36951]